MRCGASMIMRSDRNTTTTLFGGVTLKRGWAYTVSTKGRCDLSRGAMWDHLLWKETPFSAVRLDLAISRLDGAMRGLW